MGATLWQLLLLRLQQPPGGEAQALILLGGGGLPAVTELLHNVFALHSNQHAPYEKPFLFIDKRLRNEQPAN